ncbi:CrcB protein [Natronospira proteinivora]|uniref:Fluoride-specific ion channel FluC n=1 Tax=Natronospira proteinivora TaxID=1807133 RepID=A0ABT1G852_9GAMM|nr:CrcB family protein [Natronospira proteinivora]MCP1726528.1 CrcB protein [Natronospira proteinivora]
MSRIKRQAPLSLWIGLGGALGALSRFSVDQLLHDWVLAGWLPAFSATLAVNLLGSFLIGLVAVLTAEQRRGGPSIHRAQWRAFLMTGFLGGMTTASLFSLELLWHLQAGLYLFAGGYALATILLCPTMAWLGYRLGRRWHLRHLRRTRGALPEAPE